MKALTRLIFVAVWVSALALAGCRSTPGAREVSAQGAESVVQTAPPVDSSAQPVCSLSLRRPALPESPPLAVGKKLPEPGVDVLSVSLRPRTGVKFAVGRSPGPGGDQPLPEPEVAELPLFEDAHFRLIDRAVAVPPAMVRLARPAGLAKAETSPPPAPPPRPRRQSAAAAPAAQGVARPSDTPRPAAAKPSASSPQQAPAPSSIPVEESHRQLLARVDDPIAVELEGRGWMYLGMAGESGEGIAFLSSNSSGQNTSFAFRAEELGEYALVFQLQDHTRGVLRNEIVHLQVLPEEQFSAALNERTVSTLVSPIARDRVAEAERLFERGEYELALIEFLKVYREGDPYLNDRLARCYAAAGEHLAAVKYYRQNMGLTGEYGDRAVLGLVRSSIALQDAELLNESLPSLLTLESVRIEGELLEVAGLQMKERNYPAAVKTLQEYLSRYPAGGRLDEAYYLLAQMYELDSSTRDLSRARHYYRILYERFPESRYAPRAGERYRYLERHFFLVQ